MALEMAQQLGAMAFQPQQQAAAMIGGPTVLGRSSNINTSYGQQESSATSAGTVACMSSIARHTS